MKRLTIFLLAMIATFALHAQEVNDSINNNASNGRVMYFTGEVNCEWNTLGNWRVGSPDGALADSLPVEPNPDLGWIGDDVILLSNCNLNFYEWWEILGYRTLTIEDGVQLHCPSGEEFKATMKKNIEPYDLHVNDFGWNPNGWNLISIPVTANYIEIQEDTQDHPDEAPFIDYEEAGFFYGENFDFYHFNQEYPYAEWRNYRDYVGRDSTFVVHDLAYYDYDSVCNVVYDTVTHNDTLWYVVHDTVYVAQDANFVAERNGYLYANYLPTTLSFTGYLYTCAKKEHRYLRYDSISPKYHYSGYNLVGNPYPCNATVETGSWETIGENTYWINYIHSFYTLNEARNNVMVLDYNPQDPTGTGIVVPPMTALFVVATRSHRLSNVIFRPAESFDIDEGETLVRGNGVENLQIELTANGVLLDRVFMKAGKGENCSKLSLSQYAPIIYVPEDGKEYAIAYREGANMMPLCFTTAKNDIFTLEFDTRGYNGSYLHLIDNATGTDIDLLAATSTPSTGSGTEGSVASYTFNSEDAHYAARFKIVFAEEASNDIVDSFAFISNGELIINNSGAATLQVMDITGRILSSENIKGSHSMSLNLSAGVYVVRLCNGRDVKTQKIVVN